VESDIENKYNWWEDEEFVAELDERVQNCVDGKEKGFTLEELDEEIKSLKQVSI
jgi:hypothetical protein